MIDLLGMASRPEKEHSITWLKGFTCKDDNDTATNCNDDILTNTVLMIGVVGRD